MSESYVQLPPDSTGKRLRTFLRSVLGVDVHEQVVQLEGKSVATYSFSAVGSAAGADKHHLTMFNAIGSGKVVEVLAVRVAMETTAAVTGFPARFNLSRTSSDATGGTPLSAVKLDTQNVALPAQISGQSAPTGAPTAAGVVTVGSVNPEETGGAPTVDMYREDPGCQPLTLREGEGVTVQQYPTANAGAVSVHVLFRVR
jgi:hypothetical protein